MQKKRALRLAHSLLAASVFAGFLSIASDARADMYGMVIGIDKYTNNGVLDSLDGAVNDAKDIENALKVSGAKEVKLLLDKDANRDNILKSWDELLKKSQPGDLIVFSYAGHGSREDEHVKGSEATGKDSVFVLGGFNWEGAGTYERIIDDEVAVMLQKALGQDRTVIMVADSCHSGTMTRGGKPLVKHKTRFGKYPTIKDDKLKIEPSQVGEKDLEDQTKLLYIGAVQDNEQSPEFDIDGQTRGALSWSFAKALRGGADSDKDGKVTGDEIKQYVTEAIRMQTEGLQHPSVPGRTRGGIEISLGQSAKSEQAKKAASAPMEIAKKPPAIRLAILKSKESPESLAAKLKGVTLVEPPAEAQPVVFTRGRGRVDDAAASAPAAAKVPASDGTAKAAVKPGEPVDLTWDLEEKVVRTALGDVAAHIESSGDAPVLTRGRGRVEDNAAPAGGDSAKLPDVQKVVDKWRAVEVIKQLSDGKSLSISLKPHDGVHPLGAKMTYMIGGHEQKFFTLFNLAADGTVNFLYPLDDGKIKDPLEIPLGKPYNLVLKAEPPLGSDHVVAIASSAPLTGLHQAMKPLDGKPEAEKVLGLLHTHLAGKEYKMGIHGSYTGNK
ncbi:MAG: DUF4384 protein [Magnetococcales bacterium]|nr:DUF4384 protein [Magnetococcales bacterium]